MDFINKIKNNSFVNYYDSIYNSFLENQNQNQNQNIIILNQNDYNPLIQFGNYLKKYNTNLYLFFENEYISNKLENEIENHELNHYIQFNKMNYESITNSFLNLQKINKKINKLILIHIKSYDYLENIIKICSYFKTHLYIYISLLLNNKYKIYFKNELRNIINYMNNDSTKLGKVFDYDEILNYLSTIQSSKIIKIDLIHNNHYVSYGTSKLYLFVLEFY